MPRVEIRGEQYPIGDIFGDKFAFFVPPYQRPYAWTVEHAGELLEDLLAFLGTTDEPVAELNPYFLGSIVLIKRDRPEAQIVDGQQRLITLTTLLAVLRHLVPAPFKKGITQRLYEPEDPLRNIPARFRVRPKERDAQYFQEYVQSEGGIERLRDQLQPNLSDSQRNMRENTLLLLRQLSALPSELHVRLAQFIVQRCFLVVVWTPDLSSAYRIFSVLNDRGLDLSSADILKAEIIGQIAESEQAEYTTRWENTEESLGREAFNDLFDHIRAIYQRTRTKGTILEDFRQHVIRQFADSRLLIDDALVPYGAAFYVITTSSYGAEGGDKINGLLQWLNRIDNSEWIAPAMLYLRRYHNNPARLVRFLTDLERLATSMMMRRQYANKRITRYSHLLAAIEAGEDLSQPRSPLQLTSEERDATIAALNGDIYLMQARPRQYLLLRLDSSLAGADAIYSRPTITVEHVLPRNPAPDSEWIHQFPTFEDRTTLVHRLGNLVLLSRAKNTQASNFDFAQKKRVYFAGRNGVSPFALTTQVLREEEWTPEVVGRRQQELIAHLRQLWRL